MEIDNLNGICINNNNNLTKQNNKVKNSDIQLKETVQTSPKQKVYAEQFISNYAIKNNKVPFCGNTANITDIHNTNPLKKTKIKELLQDSTYIFENPKFYKFFEENKEMMVKNLKDLYDISAWGNIKARKIIPEFAENVSEKHIALLCDPGIVSRLDEFYNFAKTFPTDINELSSLELRKCFSDFLGTQKYYRGIILKEEEAREIMDKGIKPNNFKGENAQKITEDILLHYKNSYKGFIIDKVNGYNKNNPLISVSQLKSCAEKIPLMFNSSTSNKKLYVFELELPKINVIEPKGEFEVQYPGFGFFDKDNNTIPNEKVESFVPFYISPDKIISVEPQLV